MAGLKPCPTSHKKRQPVGSGMFNVGETKSIFNSTLSNPASNSQANIRRDVTETKIVDFTRRYWRIVSFMSLVCLRVSTNTCSPSTSQPNLYQEFSHLRLASGSSSFQLSSTYAYITKHMYICRAILVGWWWKTTWTARTATQIDNCTSTWYQNRAVQNYHWSFNCVQMVSKLPITFFSFNTNSEHGESY